MIVTVDGLRPGQLVRSKCGRDQGNYYLISELVGERFLRLVDGLKHPFVNPKKKNVKHVQVIMLVALEIEAALISGRSVSDVSIAATIKRMKKELEEGDRFHG